MEKKIFFRFGDLPDKGNSAIWDKDKCVGYEDGISVYEVHIDKDHNFIPVLPFPYSEKTLNDFIYHLTYFRGRQYIVSGELTGAVGTNNEPLIRNAEYVYDVTPSASNDSSPVNKFFVARNPDRSLMLFTEVPSRNLQKGVWQSAGKSMTINTELFPDTSWQSDYVACTLCISDDRYHTVKVNILDKLYICRDRLEKYNNLPWYKKIFKFHI